MAREGLIDDCGYNFDVDEDSYNSGFKDGFLRAVDEFVEKMEDEILTMFCSDREYQIAHKTLEEIAEEMRGGE